MRSDGLRVDCFIRAAGPNAWIRKPFAWLLGLCIISLSGSASEVVSLRISAEREHDANVTVVDGNAFEIQTTGSDPFVHTVDIAGDVDWTVNHILAFEYFSLTGTGDVQVFLDPPVIEDVSVHGDGLSQSEVWSSYSIDLAPALEKSTVPVRALRIDFGQYTGRTFRLRNIMLRAKSHVEREAEARKTARREHAIESDRWLDSYLYAEYPITIGNVTVDEQTVRIEAQIPVSDDDLVLVEIPVYADVHDTDAFRETNPVEGGMRHILRVDRFLHGDSLLSRWAIARRTETGLELVSHARYADELKAQWDLPDEKPRNKKGLGAFHPSRPVEDVTDLGVSAVTVNILLNGYLFAEAVEGRSAYEYMGRTWYSDDGAVARLDQTLRDAADLDLIVSAILLVPQGAGAPEGSVQRLMAHPDADPAGIYVMPDVESEEGFAAYAAVLNFLAERYSHPGNAHGRIHHWIMHNEVNSGWVWTNMGEATALQYMNTYHKSMRVMHLIARQYNPHARVYISLEHNWTTVHNDKCHTGREMLELLERYSKVEGDFEWSLAYHPYPENLGNPKTWEDRTATNSFDTPRITFKNIEVIDAWMRRPEALYLGEHIRDIQFTEQGPNSPDYSETSLRNQAAAMAYVWKKMEALDSVSMFHFHNWVDNRHEGGLRIGLRKYPDDAEDPHGKKPVWYVFQALGTDEQEVAIAFARDVIGDADWGRVSVVVE